MPHHTCPHCQSVYLTGWYFDKHVATCAPRHATLPRQPDESPLPMTPLTQKYFGKLHALMAQQLFEQHMRKGGRL